MKVKISLLKSLRKIKGYYGLVVSFFWVSFQSYTINQKTLLLVFIISIPTILMAVSAIYFIRAIRKDNELLDLIHRHNSEIENEIKKSSND